MERERTRKMYDKTPYSLREAHSILHNPEAESYTMIFSSLPQMLKGNVVLDAGCGGGALIAKMLYLGADAVGLDLSLSSLKTVSKMLKEHGWPKPLFVNADIENLPFRDEAFDVVTCWGVLHHTDYPEKGLRELAKTLKKGSVLFLMLYHQRNPWSYVKLLLRFLCKHTRIVPSILRVLPPFRDETIYNDNFVNPIAKQYTKEEVSSMCAQAGLFIEKIQVSGLPSLNMVPRKIRGYLKGFLRSYASKYGWCIALKTRCLGQSSTKAINFETWKSVRAKF